MTSVAAAGTLVGVAAVVGKWVWLDIHTRQVVVDTLQLVVPVHILVVGIESVVVVVGNIVVVVVSAGIVR